MLLNLNRPNVRGIKKCRFCGYYNGNRSKSCKNQNCPQFMEYSSCKRPQRDKRIPQESTSDPVSLITNDEVQYFSIKVEAGKSTKSDSRSFVKIEERTIETDRNTVIICRTAVCYVDSCIKSVTNIANCKHIGECMNMCRSRATEIPIIRSKFLKFFSHLTEPERIELWDYYSTCTSPAVQQLSSSLFVVKALHANKENSGGLNVDAGITDYVHCELGYKDKQQRRGSSCNSRRREVYFKCSCNKIRITLSPGDNSIIMENDLCHHILLLYCALDGSCALKEQFKRHLEFACKRLDLHELDLFDENSLSLDWDLETNELIDHLINDEILLDEELKLSDCQIELMEDLRSIDEEFRDYFKEIEDVVNEDDSMQQNAHNVYASPTRSNLKLDEMNLSVSFDIILTSIIERMNCNFNSSPPPPFRNPNETDTLQEFVFYVHNDFFSCLNERFCPDSRKKCLPCETTFHSTGSYRGLTTQLYKFYHPGTLTRIFTSKSTTIVLERLFFNENGDNAPINPHGALYSPNDTLSSTPPHYGFVRKYINLQRGEGSEDNCVRIGWTANALPTSSHGELKISFRYDYQRIK